MVFMRRHLQMALATFSWLLLMTPSFRIAAHENVDSTIVPPPSLTDDGNDGVTQASSPSVTIALDTPLRGKRSNTSTVNPEAALLKKLLRHYDRNAKPTPENGGPVVVYMGYYLGRISNLDEKRQVLSTFGWLYMDPYLSWDPTLEGVKQSLVVDSELVWMPEIALLNTVAEGNDLAFDSKFRVQVESDGLVTWVPGFHFDTTCSVHLTLFPFDSQTCHINVTNWSFLNHVVDFFNDEATIDMSLYQPHGEWTITNTSSGRYLIIREGLDDNAPGSPVVYFTIHLSRKPIPHVLNILTPSALMSVVSMMVFPLPAESGEKISLSISVLLSYAVLMLRVSDLMPNNAETVPLLTLYLTLGMVLTTVSLCMTVMILNIHHHSTDKPVPRVVRFIFMTCLGRLLCMPAVYRDGRIVHDAKRFGAKVKNTATKLVHFVQNGAPGVAATSMNETSFGAQDNGNVNDRSAYNTPTAASGHPRGTHATGQVSDPEKLLLENHAQVEELGQVGVKTSTREEWNTEILPTSQCQKPTPPERRWKLYNEWHLLASVLDRLFLLIYVAIAVGSFSILVCQLVGLGGGTSI